MSCPAYIILHRYFSRGKGEGGQATIQRGLNAPTLKETLTVQYSGEI